MNNRFHSEVKLPWSYDYSLANHIETGATNIRSINNRFHSEAKLPWSYNYPLANHIVTNKSSANRDMSLFRAFTPLSGILGKFSRQGV